MELFPVTLSKDPQVFHITYYTEINRVNHTIVIFLNHHIYIKFTNKRFFVHLACKLKVVVIVNKLI